MNQFESGVALHSATRQAGEVNMLEEVRKILRANGLAQNLPYFDGHPQIIEAENKVAVVQRHYLNRYWTTQLLMTGKHTVDERYCLLERGEISMWLQFFQDKIVPFLIENNLPGPVSGTVN